MNECRYSHRSAWIFAACSFQATDDSSIGSQLEDDLPPYAHMTILLCPLMSIPEPLLRFYDSIHLLLLRDHVLAQRWWVSIGSAVVISLQIWGLRVPINLKGRWGDSGRF